MRKRRATILSRELPPMLLARPAERRAHWAHANRQFRRPARTIGETLTALYAEGLTQRLRLHARVAELLNSELPSDLATDIALGSLRNGTLTLLVPAGPLAFHFQRGLGERLARTFGAIAP